MKRVTLGEVALKAGVSKQTVSNVLNDNPRMTAATKAMVQATIDALGYQPNHAARALRRSRTTTVAFVYPEQTTELAEPFAAQVISSIGRALRVAHHDLLTHALSSEEVLTLETLRAMFQQERIDGAIMFGIVAPDHVMDSLASWPYPLVALDYNAPDGQLPSVWAEYQTGIAQAVCYLAAQGRTRIGFVVGPAHSLRSSATARLAGYHDGLRATGLSADPALCQMGDWGYESGRTALARLLALPTPPDAVVTANDRMAIGVLQEARARGLVVPDELAIIGFDDIEFARYVDPPLSTLHLPIEAMAHEAVTLLQARLGDNDHTLQRHPQLVMPVELVLRGST